MKFNVIDVEPASLLPLIVKTVLSDTHCPGTPWTGQICNMLPPRNAEKWTGYVELLHLIPYLLEHEPAYE